jgi:hypothetical protein
LNGEAAERDRSTTQQVLSSHGEYWAMRVEVWHAPLVRDSGFTMGRQIGVIAGSDRVQAAGGS